MRKIVDISEFIAAVKSGKKPKSAVRLATSGQASVQAETRTVSFVFSDDSVDRYGDTIDARGWVLEKYQDNPVALFGHDSSSVENVIGRAKNVRVNGNQLVGDIEFMEASVNPTAEAVFQMVKGGWLNTVSVGFQPLDWAATKDKGRPGGVDFKKQELLEISIVPIPANGNALVQARAAGVDVDRLALRAAAPSIKKGLYQVSFLASILSDLGYLTDDVEWEAEYEGDNSPVPQMLADAMQQLGAALIALTVEEVNELLADPDGEVEPLIVSGDAVEMAAKSDAQKALVSLVKMAKAAKTLSGRRFAVKSAKPMTREAMKHAREVILKWVATDNGVIIMDDGLDLVVIDPVDTRGAAPLLRAGKVLSVATETVLRSAHGHMTQACDIVMGLVDANQPDDGDAAETAAAAAAVEKGAEEERARRARALRRRANLTLVEPPAAISAA